MARLEWAFVLVMLAASDVRGEYLASCKDRDCGDKQCRIIERCWGNDCTVGTACLIPEDIPPSDSLQQCDFEFPVLTSLNGGLIEEITCGVNSLNVKCPTGTYCVEPAGICCTGAPKTKGECPRRNNFYFGLEGDCGTVCQHDQECEGHQRCCETGLKCKSCMKTVPPTTCKDKKCNVGHHCLMAQTNCTSFPCFAEPQCVADKAGECPSMAKREQCLDQCGVDSHCEQDMKCCKIGGCKVCSRPAPPLDLSNPAYTDTTKPASDLPGLLDDPGLGATFDPFGGGGGDLTLGGSESFPTLNGDGSSSTSLPGETLSSGGSGSISPTGLGAGGDAGSSSLSGSNAPTLSLDGTSFGGSPLDSSGGSATDAPASSAMPQVSDNSFTGSNTGQDPNSGSLGGGGGAGDTNYLGAPTPTLESGNAPSISQTSPTSGQEPSPTSPTSATAASKSLTTMLKNLDAILGNMPRTNQNVKIPTNPSKPISFASLNNNNNNNQQTQKQPTMLNPTSKVNAFQQIMNLVNAQRRKMSQMNAMNPMASMNLNPMNQMRTASSFLMGGMNTQPGPSISFGGGRGAGGGGGGGFPMMFNPLSQWQTQQMPAPPAPQQRNQQQQRTQQHQRNQQQQRKKPPQRCNSMCMMMIGLMGS